jgi:peptide/nickel transport system ATP-binding protein
MKMGGAILSVKGLKTYIESERGTVKCVDGADLIIHAGKTLGLVGESGSGKTMVARSIMGMVNGLPGVVEGEIWFTPSDSEEPTNLLACFARIEEIYRDIRGRRISIIFQDPQNSLNPYWTVREQLAEAIRIGEVEEEKVDAEVQRWMKRVYLQQEKADSYPHELSGGMCQRVMIAIALASKPDLVIADEPTTGLDVTTQVHVTKLLRQLQADEQFAMLLISHDMGLIGQLSDSIAVMYCGRIVELGPRDEILAQVNLKEDQICNWPGFVDCLRRGESAVPNCYTRTLWGSLPEDIRELLGSGQRIQELLNGGKITQKQRKALLRAINKSLKDGALVWPGFVDCLRRGESAVPNCYTGTLWGSLPEDIRELLGSGQRIQELLNGGKITQKQRKALLKAVNEVLEQDFSRFGTTALDELRRIKKVNEFLELDPKAWSDSEIECLNRLLLEIAFPRDVNRSPLVELAFQRHPYTKTLLEAVPSQEEQQKRRRTVLLKGDIPDLVDLPSGCPFHPRCPVYDRNKNGDCKSEFPARSYPNGDHESHWLHCCQSGEPLRPFFGRDSNRSHSEVGKEVLVRVERISKDFWMKRKRGNDRERNHYFPGRLKRLFRPEKELRRVLHEISLEIYRGETLGVVGESGCGKTTLGRILLRLLSPDEGQVIYNVASEGRELSVHGIGSKDLQGLRGRMQMIFQDPYAALNSHMKIREIISEAMHIKKPKSGTDGEIRELLAQVYFSEERRNEIPAVLSGGERRRLSIARILAVEPEFIIADEPVAALDLSIKSQIIDLLEELKEDGLTYLLISHDMGTIRQVSDRIAVMYLGRIVEVGENKDIQRECCLHPYTHELLTAASVMSTIDDARNHSTDTADSGVDSAGRLIEEVPEVVPRGCPYHPRCAVWLEEKPQVCTEEVPCLQNEGGRRHQVACFFPGVVCESAP